MDLLNRYLHAVGFWLPNVQQEDIIAEFGEDLRSQIEEREAALGHPLDDGGVAASSPNAAILCWWPAAICRSAL
jgi:hypothetical protein